MAYIYLIENEINHKKYIGKTVFPIEKRWKEHQRDCLRRRNEKRPLYNAMVKYGIENFSIRCIEEVEVSKASERESYWIKYYNSYEDGYNATLGGDGKLRINYKQILKYYDETFLSQREIAEKCNCSTDSVKNIVSQYRDNVDWQLRFSYQHKENDLGIQSRSVKCVETGDIFPSATRAAKWLVSNEKVKSECAARSRIPKICRKEKSYKTCGGYHWEYID